MRQIKDVFIIEEIRPTANLVGRASHLTAFLDRSSVKTRRHTGKLVSRER